MAAAPPAAPRDGPLANPSSSSPSPSILLPAASNPAFNIKVPDKLHEPIPEHLLHHGVGRVADSGTDGVGCQDGVDGGNPQMGVGGGGGKRQRCKNPVAERKLDGSSLVPNTTKVTNCFIVCHPCLFKFLKHSVNIKYSAYVYQYKKALRTSKKMVE
jgi:hypothetical protein